MKHKLFNSEEHKIKIGLTQKSVPKGPQSDQHRLNSEITSEGLAKIHEYAEAWSYYLIKAGIDLAKEKGSCPQSQQLVSWEKQDQIERDEYDKFVKGELKGNWEGAGAIWAKRKNRPADDVFGDDARLRQFIRYKFDFKQFDETDWANYWLLAQHCDKYRDFQETALDIITQHLGTNHSHYRYLSDRLSCAKTGTQKYGTQNGCKTLAENLIWAI